VLWHAFNLFLQVFPFSCAFCFVGVPKIFLPIHVDLYLTIEMLKIFYPEDHCLVCTLLRVSFCPLWKTLSADREFIPDFEFCARPTVM